MEQELPKPEPLISNKMLGENMDVYEASLEENTSHDVTMRLNMTTAYGAGARNVRDIYEPELQRLRSQVEAMRVAGSEMATLMLKYKEILGFTTAAAAWTAALNPTPTTEPK